MSLAHLKLNPAIARETARGDVMCLVCNMTVKPKLWTAHVVGKKHKDNAQKLKEQLSAGKVPSSVLTAQKRATEPAVEATPVKKIKLDGESDLPSDFFEASVETPWQKGRQEEKEVMRELSGKGLIEGLPQGFFDDKNKDKKVRETAEKDQQMEADYEKLMREIAEQEQEKEAQREKDEDADMRQRELDNMDDQMEKWKELNELEKKKDAILEGRKQKQVRAAQRRKEEEEDDDDDDIDFDDWRAMGALR